MSYTYSFSAGILDFCPLSMRNFHMVSFIAFAGFSFIYLSPILHLSNRSNLYRTFHCRNNFHGLLFLERVLLDTNQPLNYLLLCLPLINIIYTTIFPLFSTPHR